MSAKAERFKPPLPLKLNRYRDRIANIERHILRSTTRAISHDHGYHEIKAQLALDAEHRLRMATARNLQNVAKGVAKREISVFLAISDFRLSL